MEAEFPNKTLFVFSGHWPPGSFSALRVLHIASSVSFHPAAVGCGVQRKRRAARRYRVSQMSSDEEARRVDVQMDALSLNLVTGLMLSGQVRFNVIHP
jgi:hypothetical protein